jgi:hypothetical protein
MAIPNQPITTPIKKIYDLKELNRRVLEMREKFGNLPDTEELVNTLIQLAENTTKAKVLLDNIKQPFCLDCLAECKLFIPMKLIADYDELCCPNCGIAIPKPKNEFSPTDNPEHTKLMELFYSSESKTKSYAKIERLLVEYKK